MAGVRVRVHGELTELLRGCPEGWWLVDPARRASLKDLLEARGVPHTEVYSLRAQGSEVGFSYLPRDGDAIDAYPAVPPVDVRVPTLLRPVPFASPRFIADVNVARLAGLLRILGVDCACDPRADDGAIAESAAVQKRIVLTRDRDLLKRKIVVHGRLVRSPRPRRQLQEVIAFYGLAGKTEPFSRCPRCNGTLRDTEKDRVLDRLEPLTKKYYQRFRLCGACGHVYWRGSHQTSLDRIVSDAGLDNTSHSMDGTGDSGSRGARPE